MVRQHKLRRANAAEVLNRDGMDLHSPSQGPTCAPGYRPLAPFGTRYRPLCTALTSIYNRPYLPGKGGPLMFAYSPDKFASLYATDLGQRIWSFLTTPENVARLETASELSKPAVEGIEEQLLAEFREEVLADRVKQMVGHMVRQILEQRDWVLDQSDVKVQSVPFS